MTDSGDLILGEHTSFLRLYMQHIWNSTKQCQTWGIQFWGSVYHFCFCTCTIFSFQQKIVRHGGSSFVSNILENAAVPIPVAFSYFCASWPKFVWPARRIQMKNNLKFIMIIENMEVNTFFLSNQNR